MEWNSPNRDYGVVCHHLLDTPIYAWSSGCLPRTWVLVNSPDKENSAGWGRVLVDGVWCKTASRVRLRGIPGAGKVGHQNSSPRLRALLKGWMTGRPARRARAICTELRYTFQWVEERWISSLIRTIFKIMWRIKGMQRTSTGNDGRFWPRQRILTTCALWIKGKRFSVK